MVMWKAFIRFIGEELGKRTSEKIDKVVDLFWCKKDRFN